MGSYNLNKLEEYQKSLFAGIEKIPEYISRESDKNGVVPRIIWTTKNNIVLSEYVSGKLSCHSQSKDKPKATEKTPAGTEKPWKFSEVLEPAPHIIPVISAIRNNSNHFFTNHKEQMIRHDVLWPVPFFGC